MTAPSWRPGKPCSPSTDWTPFRDREDRGGEAAGKIAAAVPLDDNVLPGHYRPLTDHLVERVVRAL
ncbi:phosphatase [Streptosporangium sp. NPDC087985]|uniref:phosphatase n=1 Tax=Streptosporangium sp. NPDC087985 TaxID=3366196 RepID=UPI0038257A06